MTPAEPLPRLRAVQITPVPLDDGRVFFELRDMLQIAPAPIAVSGAAYFVAAHLDGRRSAADLAKLFSEQTGRQLSAADVERVVRVLDEHCLLETPRFTQALEEARRSYRAADARDNRDRSPPPDVLAAQLAKILDAHDAQEAPDVGPLRGIIAPHLDYVRGEPAYRAAYTLLARMPMAERYVILGTNHFGLGTGPVATRKDYYTPLGRAVTDRDFIAQLERKTGLDLCADELDHRTEHSVELQVQVLQACYPGRPLRIVPVLCPDLLAAESAPEPRVFRSLQTLSDALGDLAAEGPGKTIVVAGADLSHVGLAFGDPEPALSECLRQVEEVDRGLLAYVEQGDYEGFAAAIRASGNPTRVCSTGCLYAFIRTNRGCRFRLLCYHQATHARSDTNVTCAAVAAF